MHAPVTLTRRTHSLTAQSALLMTGRGVGFVITFAIPMVLVRVLPQAEFGTYKQFFLVTATLLGVLDVGLAASLFYFVPHDTERAGNYVLQATTVALTTGAIVGAGLWVFREPVAAGLNSPLLVDLMPFLVVYLLLDVVGQLLELVIVVEKQARLALVVAAGSDSLRAVALVGPALATGDLRWIAAGGVAYACVRAAALSWWAVSQYRTRVRRGSLARDLGVQLRYALPFGASSVVDQGLLSYHSFYVAATVSPAAYAVYAVGCQRIPPVSIFFRSLFDVTLVRMTEFARTRQLGPMRMLWERLIAKQALFVIPLFVALWVLAPAFIETVFTAAYLGAVPIFRTYLFLLPLTMLNDHAVLRACARTRFILGANAAGAAVSLVLVPVLTATFQLPGAAAGFLAGVATRKLLGLRKVAALLEVPWPAVLPWRRLWRPVIAAALAALLVFPTQQLFGAAAARFFVCGAAFWLSYFVIAWLGNAFEPEEKQLIAQMGQRAGLFQHR